MNIIALPQIGTYFLYIGIGCILMMLFMWVYTCITPHKEFQLIREGNIAAACSLGGATLGFSLTLAASVRHNDSLSAFVLWALTALVVQVLVYFLAARLIGRVSEGIGANNVGMGVLMGMISLCAGTINAACLS